MALPLQEEPQGHNARARSSRSRPDCMQVSTRVRRRLGPALAALACSRAGRGCCRPPASAFARATRSTGSGRAPIKRPRMTAPNGRHTWETITCSWRMAVRVDRGSTRGGSYKMVIEHRCGARSLYSALPRAYVCTSLLARNKRYLLYHNSD